jgi:hypothetical protein
MITKYISLPAFLISLAIGLFFVYIFGPEQKTVYIYPSPENVEKILFQDKGENCFKLDAKQVKCPQDDNEIVKIPIQI